LFHPDDDGHRHRLDRRPFDGQQACGAFPFPLLGIDSDNGSEFINAHFLEWCTARQITFTRSRPGNKNDGCHVEQKNWTHVRELVGYLRFDADAVLALLNRIWAIDRCFQGAPTSGAGSTSPGICWP
jgi:hypothetical protein